MNNYWFKRRRYGYGWTPVTVQGWSTVLIYALVVMLAANQLLGDPNQTPNENLGLFLIVFAIATTVLVFISLRKGPQPRWRWGARPDDNPDEDF